MSGSGDGSVARGAFAGVSGDGGGEGEPGGTGRRRRVPWGTVVAVGAGLGWAALYALLYRAGYNAYVPEWLRAVDVALGVVAALVLVARPRYPLASAVVIGLLSAVSSATVAALVIALIGLTARRPWWQAAAVAAGTLLAGLPWFLLLVPRDQLSFAIVVVVLLLLGCLGWGLALKSRIRLIERLRQDVLRARADRDRRLDEARADERRRIAREMHDVLAHRMSLLSVHAGALAYRVRQSEQGQAPPPTAEELGAAVGVIRDNAHRALEELGGVLAVLRAADTGPGEGESVPGEEGGGTAPPQPTLADLDRLLREATDSGQRVSARLDLPEGTAPADRVGRSAYRVVQEGLTNARKHASGARVEVELRGGPGLGLAVSVRNPLPVGVAAAEIPGAGAGLTGLAERVRLDDGTLTHGPDQGVFHLEAELPWPEPSALAGRDVAPPGRGAATSDQDAAPSDRGAAESRRRTPSEQAAAASDRCTAPSAEGAVPPGQGTALSGRGATSPGWRPATSGQGVAPSGQGGDPAGRGAESPDRDAARPGRGAGGLRPPGAGTAGQWPPVSRPRGEEAAAPEGPRVG